MRGKSEKSLFLVLVCVMQKKKNHNKEFFVCRKMFFSNISHDKSNLGFFITFKEKLNFLHKYFYQQKKGSCKRKCKKTS